MSNEENLTEESWIDEEGNTHYGKRMSLQIPRNTKSMTLKIDDSKIAKDLREENNELKTKLNIIQEQVFNAKKTELENIAKESNIKVPEINSPVELKAFQKFVEENQGKRPSSREIPLSKAYPPKQKFDPINEGKPILERSYDSYSSLFSDLEKAHRNGDVESTKILHKLTRKSAKDLVNGSEYEFDGKITEGHNPEEKLKWKKVR